MNNRYDFMFFIQAEACNPNGDPDLENLPRFDPETNIGIITDVAIKSRIRQYIFDQYGDEPGYDMLIKDKNNINKQIAHAVLDANEVKELKGVNTKVDAARKIMCQRFFDVRTFGGVLDTGLKAGQVQGPVQIAMALSVDPISPEMITITRCCFTEGSGSNIESYEEAESKMEDNKKRTMGQKTFIPYGLYCVKGSISPKGADITGFSEKDLERFFEGVVQSYNYLPSSSKQGMSVLTPVIVFKHIGTSDASNEEQKTKESRVGCSPAYQLYKLIKVQKKNGVVYPRSLDDYEISVNKTDVPDGVKLLFKNSAFGCLSEECTSKDIKIL